MTTYQMDCSCGDTMKIEGATRDEAVLKLKAMMNDSMLSTHMKEKHPGEPMIPVAQVHAMIEQNVRAA
jgi:hypothetical protein